MSDRRAVVLVLAALAAMLGVAVCGAAALALRDPFTRTGEIGTRVDISHELIMVIAVGLLLVIAGVGSAVALLRARPRAFDR